MTDRVEQSARVVVADRVDYAPLELGRHDVRGNVAAARRRRGMRRALTLALMLLGLAASSAAGANRRQRTPRAHRLVAVDKHREQQLRQPNRLLHSFTTLPSTTRASQVDDCEQTSNTCRFIIGVISSR